MPTNALPQGRGRERVGNIPGEETQPIKSVGKNQSPVDGIVPGDSHSLTDPMGSPGCQAAGRSCHTYHWSLDASSAQPFPGTCPSVLHAQAAFMYLDESCCQVSMGQASTDTAFLGATRLETGPNLLFLPSFPRLLVRGCPQCSLPGLPNML